MGGNWESVTRNIFTYVSAMQHTSSTLCMLKKTHLSTYKHPWPCVNFTFRVIQTLFLHLTKGSFCFISDKQTAFKGKLPHSYMKYSALEKCSEYLEHRTLMKLTFSGMALRNVHIKEKWQWTVLKKNDFISFGLPFMFLYNNLSGHFLSTILKVWYYIMDY